MGLLSKTPSVKQLEAAAARLTPYERGLLEDLNRLALGASLEAMCAERKERLGLVGCRDWLADLKAFANRWPGAYL